MKTISLTKVNLLMNNIIYEDNHLIVVYKDSGMLTQSDITGDKDLLSEVKNYIKIKYHKPGNVYLGMVQRLDRMTSGLIVFARTSKAASRLSEDIRKHKVEKKYLAVCHDNFKRDKGRLTDKIAKIDKKAVISPEGKEAILDYEVIARKKGQALVSINLVTGRYNQIRCQLASLGSPIYSDYKYGNSEDGNLALSAYYLSFTHPVTKEKLCFKKMIIRDAFKNFEGEINEFI